MSHKTQTLKRNKVKPLGSEILLSVKTSNEEWIVLLGLVHVGSYKSLGKREVMKTLKGVVTKTGKIARWKAKSGMLETKELASVSSMEPPHFDKCREFDTRKLHLHDDPDKTWHCHRQGRMLENRARRTQ